MKFDSFAALGAAMGFKEPQRKTPKAKKCRQCGAVMRLVPGTNVFLCTGTVKNEKTGEDGPCPQRAISTPKSSKDMVYKDVILKPVTTAGANGKTVASKAAVTGGAA